MRRGVLELVCPRSSYPNICYEVCAEDISHPRRFLQFLKEPLKVSFEFVTNNSVRILQAERLPEEGRKFELSLRFITVKPLRLNGAWLDCYLVTVDLARQLQERYDHQAGKFAPLENVKATQLQLPPEWLSIFSFNPVSYHSKEIIVSPRMDCKDRFVCGIGEPFQLDSVDKYTPLIHKTTKDYLLSGESPDSASEEHGASKKRKRRSIPVKMRNEVLLRDGHQCVDCGASPAKDPLVTLEVDHRVPDSKGVPTVPENLQTLCWACNRGKGVEIDHKLSDDPWGVAA